MKPLSGGSTPENVSLRNLFIVYLSSFSKFLVILVGRP